MPVLLFRGIDGARRAIRLGIVDRIEEVPADAIRQGAGQLRVQLGEAILPLAGVAQDAAFEGKGCAISQASASLMNTHLKVKTHPDAEDLFKHFNNNLTKGEMTLAGRKLSLADVTIPIYNLATREDHIAPARSVFLGCRFFGGEVEYVMAGSGHIAGVVNPPSLGKYQHWTDGKPEGSFDDWIARATEHPGSWWPHWHAWIERQDDRRAKARKPGGAKLKPLADAPGDYVKVRV